MASLMSSVMGDATSIAKYIRNCKEMNIDVLPPSVHESFSDFVATDDGIRFGLMGVKSVGESVVDAIIFARETSGIPRTFADFIRNIDISKINKRAIESLIKAGAFDCIEKNRAVLMAVYQQEIEGAQQEARNTISGQISLFQINEGAMQEAGLNKRLPNINNFSKSQILELEKEVMGIYISGHPLEPYAEKIKEYSTVTSDVINSEESETLQNNSRVVICGLVASMRKLTTKKSQLMAFVNLEDLFGSAEIVVFPKVYQKSVHMLESGEPLVVVGRINVKEDAPPAILADEIRTLEEYEKIMNGEPLGDENLDSRGADSKSQEPTNPIKLRITKDHNIEEVMTDIERLLMINKGDVPVRIYLPDGRQIASRHGASISDFFVETLRRMLGEENVKIQGISDREKH